MEIDELQRIIRELEASVHDLKAGVRERNTTIRDCVVEHNQHADQLCARIEYLEAVNKGLESDISNLRIANALYRKRWSDHENEATIGDIVNIHKHGSGYWKGTITDISSELVHKLSDGEVLHKTLYTRPMATIKEINGTGHALRAVTILRIKDGEYYDIGTED